MNRKYEIGFDYKYPDAVTLRRYESEGMTRSGTTAWKLTETSRCSMDAAIEKVRSGK